MLPDPGLESLECPFEDIETSGRRYLRALWDVRSQPISLVDLPSLFKQGLDIVQNSFYTRPYIWSIEALVIS